MKNLIYKLLRKLFKMQEQKFSLIIQKLNKMSTQQEKLQAAIEALDAATTEVGNDLQALRDKIAAGTVDDATLSELDATIARLQLMGQDPADPDPGTGGNIEAGGGAGGIDAGTDEEPGA